MLFAITCLDRPGALETRLATRPAHLAWLESQVASLVLVGPFLDAEGKPCGSLLVIEAPDQAAAQAFANADPYAQAGLFESAEIRPFRTVFKDGAKAG
jgi:uncharacterized protein YciI